MSGKSGNPRASQEAHPDRIEQEILQAIRGISYGSVEVIIHDGKIVQILRKEKLRFDQKASTENS
jgi:hypothetical protein